MKKKYFTLERWVAFLHKFSQQNGMLFTFSAFSKISGLNSESALRKALLRLEQKGLIKRVGSGLYLNLLKPARVEEVAMVLGKPCYISFESALSYYGVLSQIPLVLTCATIRKPFTKETPVGTILFRHLKRELFWGYLEKDGILYAETEKALLDWVYWSKKTEKTPPLLDEINWSELHLDKLRKYVLSFPKSVQKVLNQQIQNMRKR